ncbi:MAG TPA: sensor domain-containing diguanylate cyclase [Acidimicrobiales bacterium]|nr:sensor domain-containing diguanylate cyclase [Acidimicrobiales bacterium]
MPGLLSRKLIGRVAGVLLALGGTVTLITCLLPSEGDWDRLHLAAVGAVAVGLGGIVYFLPWYRWPRKASLVIVPLAFLVIAVGNSFKQDPWTYAIYFVLVFVWLGMAHPRGTSFYALPAMGIAYLVPLFIATPQPNAPSSLLVVMPVCLLVGESLAFMAYRLVTAGDRERRGMQIMERLLEASEALARQSDPTTAANLVAELGVGLFSGTQGLVLLLDDDAQLHGAGSYRWAEAEIVLQERWLESPVRAALDDGQVRRYPDHPARANVGSPCVIVPMSGPGRATGALVVALSAPRGELDRFMADIARTFATQAGLALERARTTQALLHDTMRDELTGVGNRRQLAASLERIRPGDAVALIDCDHFKDVNARYGHTGGDQVLADLGAVLGCSVRERDSVARYGGDEFLVVLHQAGTQTLAAVERLLDQWRATSPTTTISAGVALHRDGDLASTTVARADAALYRAKAAGRDQVRLGEDLDVLANQG